MNIKEKIITVSAVPQLLHKTHIHVYCMSFALDCVHIVFHAT